MTASASPLSVAVNPVASAAVSGTSVEGTAPSTGPRRNFVSTLADVREANSPGSDQGEQASAPPTAKSGTETDDEAASPAKAGSGGSALGVDPTAGAQAQATQQAALAQLLAAAPAPVRAPASPARGVESESAAAGAIALNVQATLSAAGQAASSAATPSTQNPALLALSAAAAGTPGVADSPAVPAGLKGSMAPAKGAVKSQTATGAMLTMDDEPSGQIENSQASATPSSHIVDKGVSVLGTAAGTAFGDPSSGTGSDAAGSGQAKQDDLNKLALLVTGTAGANTSPQASQVSLDAQFAVTATSAATGSVATATSNTTSVPTTDTSGAAGLNAPVIHENVGTARWADELGAKLTVMATRGEQTGSLRLSPAHLGPLQVDITVRNDQASVQFGAQHADTRAALQDALPRLREMFAASGLVLGDAGVSREAPRQHAPAPTAIRGFTSASGEEPTVQTLTVNANALNAHRGVLDTYA